MKKFVIGIVLSSVILLIPFSNKLVEKYVVYKLSKWVEKDIIFEEFNFEYPNLIEIKGLEIKNPNPFYYNNIFEANIININIDLKSYLFNKLVMINELRINNPIFYLELIVKNDIIEKNKKKSFEDNKGIAKKLVKTYQIKFGHKKKKIKIFLYLKAL